MPTWRNGEKMKGLISEFKTFITRGNVIDMSVGVIVGGAFTAIVNGVSNFVLKPIINFIIAKSVGGDALTDAYIPLGNWVMKDVLDEAGVVVSQEIDYANSFYIDYGSLILAIINFFITAFVLFLIVKMINAARDGRCKLTGKAKLTGAQHKELKAHGIKIRDKKAVEAYFAEKQRLADEAAAAEAAAAAEKARLEREANPTTEDLLKQILAELKNK